MFCEYCSINIHLFFNSKLHFFLLECNHQITLGRKEKFLLLHILSIKTLKLSFLAKENIRTHSFFHTDIFSETILLILAYSYQGIFVILLEETFLSSGVFEWPLFLSPAFMDLTSLKLPQISKLKCSKSAT